MKNGNPNTRFSYADDIGILGIGRSVVESVAAVQHEVDNLVEWADRNAVSFDYGKSEVMRFTGR